MSSLESFLNYEGEDVLPRKTTMHNEAVIERYKRIKARKYNPIIDNETRIRIKVALYAYAYEYEATSLVSDAEFDSLCYQIDLNVNTRRPDLDTWFRKYFQPHTGQWIHNHPELEKIKSIYHRYYHNK